MKRLTGFDPAKAAMKQNLPTQFDHADMSNITRAFHYPAAVIGPSILRISWKILYGRS
jgi:hypothetical protein